MASPRRAQPQLQTGHPIERAARRLLRRARPGVGVLVLALSLISSACASRTTTPASQAGSRVSFVIGAHSLAAADHAGHVLPARASLLRAPRRAWFFVLS